MKSARKMVHSASLPAMLVNTEYFIDPFTVVRACWEISTRWRRSEKLVWQLILPDWICSSLSLCKLSLINLKKLHTKCGVNNSPLLLFRKFADFFHTLCVIFVLSDYRKCMDELRFSKKQQRTVGYSRVSSFFKFISYIFQREIDKYIQLERI